MNTLTLYTSGSTDTPKEVTHTWEYIDQCIAKSINEINLTSTDIVLDVFPSNTIAHYTITAGPAKEAGAKLVSLNFDPYNYLRIFRLIKPTFIALIPRHYEILKRVKEFERLDMSSVRYMVTGSSKIDQTMIDTFVSKGVTTVANWYGMTEVPPPVMVSYNSTTFTKIDDNVSFSKEGECIINGFKTGDIFDINTMTFSHRKSSANGKTWKTNF